jgi:serine/threonine-protein kinase
VADQADQLDRVNAALASRYAIERELGRGGMATVYLAEDLRHDRKVAIKVLKPELPAAIGLERFLREIEITACLDHPHILPLLDSGEADSFLFYVMPYVEGRVVARPTQLREAASHREGIRNAVIQVAHHCSLLHRCWP